MEGSQGVLVGICNGWIVPHFKGELGGGEGGEVGDGDDVVKGIVELNPVIGGIGVLVLDGDCHHTRGRPPAPIIDLVFKGSQRECILVDWGLIKDESPESGNLRAGQMHMRSFVLLRVISRYFSFHKKQIPAVDKEKVSTTLETKRWVW